MGSIKARRLHELQLSSHHGLFVGQCVPFYFCPRSIMLYLIHCANHEEMTYRGGQVPIIHLVSDLRSAVDWAEAQKRRWAFTLSNAGARYFEDRCDLNALGEINWDAVATNRWADSNISPQIKEGKQAEFLVERSFPWHLVEQIGVRSRAIAQQVVAAMQGAAHRPPVEIRTDWYY
jgi:ssDNA thymidine ADP-ribosyltransferase, DarT